jgi:CO/xanthine dehydrogenase Mo-binding subunit
MGDATKYKWVGTRSIRPDGVEKVTGRANFGADRSVPGMLYGFVLRSPHAHARIRSIDTSKAASVEGVKAVLTGADLPEITNQRIPGDWPVPLRDLAHNVMARGKALYEGHAIAAVAATTARVAREAAALIEVDYEVLEPVMEVLAAMKPDAPLLHDDLFTKGVDPVPDKPSNVASRGIFERGDLEAGFAEADVVIEREFRTETVHQAYIEPHAAVAEVGEDDQATVWCCTQGPFMVRAYSAAVLQLPVSKVKVVPSEIGGGFGGKTTVYIEPIAIALSRKSGRPVKVVMDRADVFRATGPAPGSFVRVKLGAKKDGTLTAGEVWLAYEGGGFPGAQMMAGLMTILTPYKLNHFKLEGFDVVVNKPKTAAYRAPGAPMAAYASESVIDEVAKELGIDPIEFRLKNAATEGTQATYGPKFKRIGFCETLEAAAEHPHYRAELGPNQGRGVASGFWFNAGMNSSAEVAINEDGTASVVVGTPDIGGSRASMALMCAEELGVELDRVRPVVADTETTAFSDLTGGSRVTFATGMAVVEAARDVKRQLCRRAAMLWEVEPDQVEWREGAAHPVAGLKDAPDPLPLDEIARKAGRTGGPIGGRCSLNARSPGPAFATHVVDVEVDRETGKVKILRYTAVQDVGTAIHPSYVEGQIQGGAVQGIGWALNEEYVYDEKGALQNAGFLDYRVPVALDVPMIDTVIVEVPNPSHPYGVRGVGEVPIVPPIAAVANAIADAIGVRMFHAPMSPPRVLATLQSSGPEAS